MRGSSGDAWVEGPDGTRYWGRFGAAGLLAVTSGREVLLQHRAEWSHYGGTWGIPGGARHEHETAIGAAIREANEEAGVPAELVEVRFSTVLDLGFWSYTTVVADVVRRFDPVAGDAESIELRWTPADEVALLPLHPRFAEAWPALRERI
ncbi:NUDIX hydrolase [Agromyces larvae]|uniref:NUDIX hydrolase n=1 Tax=Agromyces larvae TaxID=2929802 RepID=UPI00338D88AC